MPPLQVRRLGLIDYRQCWQQMRDFVDQRTDEDADELWVLEHPPIFTLGQAGKLEHLLNPGSIEVVTSDRGGQVTYHGPGQLVLYCLLHLKRYGLGVRALVTLLEQSLIETLAEYQLAAEARADAPGVYLAEKKIASIGLRIRRGFSYHGLALNVSMDLVPFQAINPCGYPGLEMTRLADWIPTIDQQQVTARLLDVLTRRLALCYQTTSG